MSHRNHRFSQIVGGLDDHAESIASDFRGFSPYPQWDGIHEDEQERQENLFFGVFAFFVVVI